MRPLTDIIVFALGLSLMLSQCSCTQKVQEPDSITVFAAASTTDAVTEIAKRFTKQTGITVDTHFAASSTLARQIEAGAEAHVVLSANTKWIDWLGDKQLIDPNSRCDLLTNRLVLIVPKGQTLGVSFDANDQLADHLTGTLAMGDPTHVPAGMYAKQVLDSLGWYDRLEDRFLPGASVRVTLAYVERGEAQAGIVYATDAAASDQVTVVAEIPAALHDPIMYPAAVCQDAGEQAVTFLDFLKSDRALAVFESHGFSRGGQ